MDETIEDAPYTELFPEIISTPALGLTFVPPSILPDPLFAGRSYTHYSPLPPALLADPNTECALGIDEAGRGPVLGPMVYALLYLPLDLERPLLAETAAHRFDDSKALTPSVRSALMRALCTSGTPLHDACGWATSVMSARDISAGMLQPGAGGSGRGGGGYNLNAQAYDATAALLAGVLARGVNVRRVFIDTVGSPAAYQARLARLFPTLEITVAKKADSLYPCVSAASVCAKVTRDAALEACWEAYAAGGSGVEAPEEQHNWGSGYPSDARCTTWLKRSMDPLFGWGAECRFSWGTAKELLEPAGKGGGGAAARVDWPVFEVDEEEDSMKLTDFFSSGPAPGAAGQDGEQGGLAGWFSTRVAEEVF